MKEITKARLAEAQSTGPKLCVDLSMTDSMSDKVGDWLASFYKTTIVNGNSSDTLELFQEISRLASQLRRLYGSNKKATRPFHVFLTSMCNTSRLYKECLRMNDGFLHYVVIIILQPAAEDLGQAQTWRDKCG